MRKKKIRIEAQAVVTVVVTEGKVPSSEFFAGNVNTCLSSNKETFISNIKKDKKKNWLSLKAFKKIKKWWLKQNLPKSNISGEGWFVDDVGLCVSVYKFIFESKTEFDFFGSWVWVETGFKINLKSFNEGGFSF